MPEIPDRISQEALRSYLGGAGCVFPTPLDAPVYNLKGPDAGAMDFSIVLQSIIEASKGVSMVQLSQATFFLLSAMSSLHESVLTSVSEDSDSKLPPGAKAIVIEKLQNDIKLTAVMIEMLESICCPVLEAAVYHKIALSGRPPSARLVRQALVSDDVCKRLGLNTGEIAVYFETAIRRMVDH